MYRPPPFVHTKLFVVDDYYAHIGTANMDPRSLRLNFELVLEVYDRKFISMLSEHIIDCRERSKQVTLAEIDLTSSAGPHKGFTGLVIVSISLIKNTHNIDLKYKIHNDPGNGPQKKQGLGFYIKVIPVQWLVFLFA